MMSPYNQLFFQTKGENRTHAIARWVYAESSEGVEKFLKTPVADAKALAPAISFEVTEGKLILFDSAMPWPEILKNHQRANLEVGSYLVTTEKHQWDKKFSFIVHRFLRKSAEP